MKIGDKVWTVIEYVTSYRAGGSYMYCLEEYQIVSHEPHFGMVCVTDGQKLKFYHSNDLIFTKPENCTEENYKNWYQSKELLKRI